MKRFFKGALLILLLILIVSVLSVGGFASEAIEIKTEKLYQSTLSDSDEAEIYAFSSQKDYFVLDFSVAFENEYNLAKGGWDIILSDLDGRLIKLYEGVYDLQSAKLPFNGNFKLTVKAHNEASAPSGCAYKFRVSTFEDLYYESEENGGFDSANIIITDKTYTGAIQPVGGIADKDYYRAVVNSKGFILNFSLKNSANYGLAKGGWDITVYGDDGKIIRAYEGIYDLETPPFAYSGEFYIGIQAHGDEPSRVPVDCYYNLSLVGYENEFYESEENNSLINANLIETGKTYLGCLESARDVDWYKFTSQKDCFKLSLSVDTQKNYASPKSGWKLIIFGENGETVKAYDSDSIYDLETAVLPYKGTFYALVYSFSEAESAAPIDCIYNLKAESFDFPNYESESNDIFAQSNALPEGEVFAAALQNKEDEDWFNFENEGCIYSIDFSVKQGNYHLRNKGWRLSVYDFEEKLISETVLSEDYSAVISGKGESAAYYLKVEAVSSAENDAPLDCVYQLKVTTQKSHEDSDADDSCDKCERSLALGKPMKLTSQQNTSAIRLSWEAVSGADGYRIFYKVGNGWKQCLGGTTKTEHTFSKLPSGEKYTFAVQAGKYVNGKVKWSNSYSEINTATKALKPINVTSAQNASAIKLTWAASKGATGYRIYFRTNTKNSWSIAVSRTNKLSHTFTGLKPNQAFQLAVRPYIINNGAVIWSDYITIIASTTPEMPLTKATSSVKGKVDITWTGVNGATGYQLFYKEGNDSWKLFKNYSRVSALRFPLKSSSKYSFAVRAYRTIAGCTFYSSYRAVSLTVK